MIRRGRRAGARRVVGRRQCVGSSGVDVSTETPVRLRILSPEIEQLTLGHEASCFITIGCQTQFQATYSDISNLASYVINNCVSSPVNGRSAPGIGYYNGTPSSPPLPTFFTTSSPSLYPLLKPRANRPSPPATRLQPRAMVDHRHRVSLAHRHNASRLH